MTTDQKQRTAKVTTPEDRVIHIEREFDALGPQVPLAADQREVVLFGLAFA